MKPLIITTLIINAINLNTTAFAGNLTCPLPEELQKNVSTLTPANIQLKSYDDPCWNDERVDKYVVEYPIFNSAGKKIQFRWNSLVIQKGVGADQVSEIAKQSLNKLRPSTQNFLDGGENLHCTYSYDALSFSNGSDDGSAEVIISE